MNRTSAEGVSCSCGLDSLYVKSLLFYPQIFIVSSASVFSHGQENQRDLIFLLKGPDTLVVIFFSGHELDLVIRNFQHITILESILHHFFGMV